MNKHLEQLLINYIHIMYEDNSRTDTKHLLAEYDYLKKTNNLHVLFEVSNFLQEAI